MGKRAPLNMGNITDNETEKLIAFLDQLARMEIYDDEEPQDGDQAWNWAVETARKLMARKPN